MTAHEKVLIFDLGSQYTQLIARRIRELKVFCEIVRHDLPAAEVARQAPKGIVLSGGPASVYEHQSPRVDPAIFELGIPVLGICYGLQLMAEATGGKVGAAQAREYGHTRVTVDPESPLFRGLPRETVVWNSHGDLVTGLDAAHFRSIATTGSTPFAAVAHASRPLYGVQFHPEVVHSKHGREVLANFVRGIAGCAGDWTMGSFVDEAVATVRAQVGERGRVVCGLSGGVDSAVVALLLDRALGERLTCIFVDNGLLRLGEAEEVEAAFRPRLGDRLRVVHAGERFLGQLAGVVDPEVKRKRIGHEFVAVFKDAALDIPDAHFLAQGTLYPDVIESRSAFGGPSATIKTHHNVGGLPAELGFELIEPLRQLFKDEVRRLGKELELEQHLIDRQPFPGPGLAVRVLGEVTPARLDLVRQADAIVREELKRDPIHPTIWQAFAVLLPVQSVGVMGDARTYEATCVVRVVESQDGMTADWVRVPHEVLATISSRITNEVRGINRVVYDVTSKPPGTIEWE
ncbi:MAG: glutamine-hydrolyzing GMP synthase [Planctomycetes bacterium]|nr:glutamine-hydrolyzing GMP synthase [Planctomycetota bacterium]